MTTQSSIVPAEVEASEVVPITPMQMLQTAVQQGADLDKLERLMDLQQRWEANEARKAFVVAKAAFRADAPKIDKNKRVAFESKRGGNSTDYHHATLDHVESLLAPVISKHGLDYSWVTEQPEGGMIRVTCILTHIQGHSERVSLQAGSDQSGNKNNIQAVGSTTTYLSRYTLLMALGLSTGDADDDAAGASLHITEEQKDAIVREMDELNVDAEAFLRHLKIDCLDHLLAINFNKAMNALKAKRAKAGGAK